MWIRSQDRKRLANVELVVIVDKKIYATTSTSEVTLGVYPTEERAIEVLDKLQSAIVNCTAHDEYEYSTANGNICDVYHSDSVYEMPEE